MNIFDYIKWSKEQKKEEKRLEKIDKITIEISEFVWEIEKLKEKARVYQEANKTLVLSNHDRVADFLFQAAKKTGRLEGLKRVLDNLRKEQ